MLVSCQRSTGIAGGAGAAPGRGGRTVVEGDRTMNLLVVIALGLVIGWLASRYIRIGGFGIVGDLAAGALGAAAGAFLLGRLMPGAAPASVSAQAGAAALGACALVALTRALTTPNPLAARLGLQHPDTVGPLSEPLRQRLGAERGLGARDAAALRVRQQ